MDGNGIRSFPFGSWPIFRCENVSFRENKLTRTWWCFPSQESPIGTKALWNQGSHLSFFGGQIADGYECLVSIIPPLKQKSVKISLKPPHFPGFLFQHVLNHHLYLVYLHSCAFSTFQAPFLTNSSCFRPEDLWVFLADFLLWNIYRLGYLPSQ